MFFLRARITNLVACAFRIWERTEEQILLDEQKEMELEQAWEQTLEEENRYEVQDVRLFIDIYLHALLY